MRASKRNKVYCIESDVDSYEENCKQNLESECVAKILEKVLGYRDWHIASIGVGKANLEWHLKCANPKLYTNFKNVFNKQAVKISWCYTEYEFLRM